MLGHILGLDNVSGAWYAFWSGFGSILERLVELAVIGYVLLRKHNCHHPRCPRIGRFPDGEWHVCKKHHPHERPGADRG